ncbi:MAG: metallophosphoesterase family protein [Pirellulales bacterium]
MNVRSPWTRRCCCGLLICLALAVRAGAHDEADEHVAQPAISAKEQHRATILPDRVLLSWSGNPAHTQDVTWRTSTEVPRSFVEYAVDTGRPDFVDSCVRIEAVTRPFESDLGTYHLHTARMAALAPATRYGYRVGDGVNWSEWFQFTTASAEPKPFSFIYFGDAQNDIRSMWSRVIRTAHSDAPKAAFMLHAGDLINDAENDAQWGEWFGGGQWLNATIPSVATPGNHEYRLEPEVEGQARRSVVSKYWRPTFAFPENGPPGLEETVYWFDYQGVRFVLLNSNEQIETQVDWLKKTLESNTNKWTIVAFHHPVYSSARGRDNATLRKLWKPVFDEYRVDLVLQGHDHSYARTGLSTPENTGTGVNVIDGPTVYVVSVSGPKQYAIENRDFFERTASGAQLYQIIHVDGDTLKYEARLANGELYDGFELHKRTGQFNELTNDIPATPEISLDRIR